MPHPADKEQQKPPNEKQITELSITLRIGGTISIYSINSVEDLIGRYTSEKFVRIETGAKSDSYEDTVMVIPQEDILIFAVSKILRPSGLLVPPKHLSRV